MLEAWAEPLVVLVDEVEEARVEDVEDVEDVEEVLVELVAALLVDFKHCEYQSFEKTQVNPESQVVEPE